MAQLSIKDRLADACARKAAMQLTFTEAAEPDAPRTVTMVGVRVEPNGTFVGFCPASEQIRRVRVDDILEAAEPEPGDGAPDAARAARDGIAVSFGDAADVAFCELEIDSVPGPLGAGPARSAAGGVAEVTGDFLVLSGTFTGAELCDLISAACPVLAEPGQLLTVTPQSGAPVSLRLSRDGAQTASAGVRVVLEGSGTGLPAL